MVDPVQVLEDSGFDERADHEDVDGDRDFCDSSNFFVAQFFEPNISNIRNAFWLCDRDATERIDAVPLTPIEHALLDVAKVCPHQITKRLGEHLRRRVDAHAAPQFGIAYARVGDLLLEELVTWELQDVQVKGLVEFRIEHEARPEGLLVAGEFMA